MCIVQELIKYFLKGSLSFSISDGNVKDMTLTKQQEFLDATIKNKLLQKYPVNREFCRLFFKKLINSLEPSQEVHDDFYTHLCSVLTESSCSEFCYRHYVIAKDLDKIVTIKETKNIVVNGTTGMRTWEGALILADFILSNETYFIGKNILELGSGVGFTGIVTAKFCDIQSVLMSDCHPDVLSTINENIIINFPDHTNSTEATTNIKTRTYYCGKKCIGSRLCDWNDISYFNFEVPIDIVIGSDIVYDPSIIQPLCNVIRVMFSRNTSLEVYIASIIRNEDTYKMFLSTLDSMNFTVETIPHTTKTFIDWDTGVSNTLIKIYLQ